MNGRRSIFAAGLVVAVVAGLVVLAGGLTAPGTAPAPTTAPVLTATSSASPRPVTITPQTTAMAQPAAAVVPNGPTAILTPAERLVLATDTPVLPTPQVQEYTVQSGDTLIGIAYQYGVAMADIQMANDLGEGTLLFEGQRLIIPTPRPEASLALYWVAYTVLPGDTLYALASRFELDFAELMRVNGLGEDDVLVVGRTLVIPADRPLALSAPLPAPTDTPAPPGPASATPAGSATLTATPAATIPYTGGNDQWAALILGLMNQARVANGLPELVYNGTLALAAQGHANDCAQRGWGSHIGSDGADLRTRLTRVGYTPIVAAGENWAWNRSPEAAFTAWYDEPPGADPHRRNILNTRYAEVGIGIAPSDLYGGGYFFIADFGHR